MPSTAGRGGTYALGDLARTLCLNHKPVRDVIDTLRSLARHDGMPLPRTPRVVRDEVVRGPRSIVKCSRWDAGEIDAWLDGRGPSPVAAARTDPHTREALKERARLVAIGGR